MKTIYTDRYGIYPWAMLAVSCSMFALAYHDFSNGDGNRLGLNTGAGAVFLILAVKRFLDIRRAKREGRDHTIVRIKQTGG